MCSFTLDDFHGDLGSNVSSRVYLLPVTHFYTFHWTQSFSVVAGGEFLRELPLVPLGIETEDASGVGVMTY